MLTKNQNLGAFSSGTYYWLSAVKPIATIMIVRSYREYVARKVILPLCCVGASAKVRSFTSSDLSHAQHSKTITMEDSSNANEVY